MSHAPTECCSPAATPSSITTPPCRGSMPLATKRIGLSANGWCADQACCAALFACPSRGCGGRCWLEQGPVASRGMSRHGLRSSRSVLAGPQEQRRGGGGGTVAHRRVSVELSQRFEVDPWKWAKPTALENYCSTTLLFGERPKLLLTEPYSQTATSATGARLSPSWSGRYGVWRE
jgi:hypothetical protein